MNFIHHHKSVAKSKSYNQFSNILHLKNAAPQVYDTSRIVPYTHIIRPKISHLEHYIKMNRKTMVIKPPEVEVPAPKNKIYSIIPLNLFQTWHTLNLPPKMKENVDLLKSQNPEFTHYLYDDDMCREFIKQHFDEDVLYTFNKLKPGAYKADLWRYCVLYVHGGIYLDIKYRCVNDFKLIELTNKEYYVKDRPRIINGIYQALMVHLPHNSILLKAIHTIVDYCKHNMYTEITPLCVTGPGLLYHLMKHDDFLSLELENIGDIIIKNNKHILEYYKEYRIEQTNTQKTSHYDSMWRSKDVYHYPTLKSTDTYNFSNHIQQLIDKNTYTFYRGTPTIVEFEDKYIMNIRWVNYTFHQNGSMEYKPRKWVSLNSRFLIDKQFNQLSPEVFLQENNYKGLEDIRIFKYNDNYYYIASLFDDNRNVPVISSDVYTLSTDAYKLNRNIILPDMYDINDIKIYEKNWSFVNYRNELCVIYNWFPLQIGKIDYPTNKMNVIDIKYNIPDYFKDARGSTCGYTTANEIWFVLHKKQSGMIGHNYQHFFAIFDMNMNIIKYSELFKFGDCKVEFCTGLIVQENSVILSYSLMDTQCFVSTYSLENINNLKWYSIQI